MKRKTITTPPQKKNIDYIIKNILFWYMFTERSLPLGIYYIIRIDIKVYTTHANTQVNFVRNAAIRNTFVT